MSDNTLTAAKDAVVSFHYRLREVLDGNETELEDSYNGDPVTYLHGHSNIILGLENALAGHKAGEDITVTLPPEQAYGPRRDNAVQRVPIKHLQRQDKKRPIKVGDYLAVQTEKGVKNVVALKVGRFNVDVDFNHPLAGRTLAYDIHIAEIRAASAEELSHGHAHGVGGHQH